MAQVNKNDTPKLNKNNSNAGSIQSAEGYIYEKLVISLLIRNGHNISLNRMDDYKDFTIGREFKSSLEMKFDDVVFRYHNSKNENQFIFTQVKYKHGDHQIDSNILANEKPLPEEDRFMPKDPGNMRRDFNLKKYFISYLIVRNQLKIPPLDTLENGNVMCVVIFTNSSLNTKDLEENEFPLEKAPDEITALFTLNNTSVQEHNHYRLKNVNTKLREIFKKYSHLHRLAKKLAKYIISEKPIDDKIVSHIKYFSDYFQVNLKKEMFDKKKSHRKQCCYKFKAEFLDNKLGPKKELLDAILAYIKLYNPNVEGNLLKKVQCEIKTSIKSKNENRILFDKIKLKEENDIEKFLNSLIFVTNQPQKNCLKSAIANLIPDTLLKDTAFFKLFNKIKNIDVEFTDYTEDILMIKKNPTFKETWISGENIKEFSDQLIQEIKIIALTSVFENEVTQYGLFCKLEKLEENLDNFLNRNDHIVLCLCVQDTKLSLVKLFQYFKIKKGYPMQYSNIIISSHDLIKKENRESVIQIFKTKCNNLLCIECINTVQDPDMQEFYNELSFLIKNNRNKKFILITQQNENAVLIQKFKNEFQSKCQVADEEINLKDFKPNIDPFEKEIIFMEHETMKLSNLCGINNWDGYLTCLSEDKCQNKISKLMNAKTLSEILGNKEIKIGSKPLGITDLDGAYAELIEEINLKILRESILQDSNSIYVISGLKETDESERLETVIKNLEIPTDQEDDNTENEQNIFDSDNTERNYGIRAMGIEFREENFKKICYDNPDKIAYWINMTFKENKSEFILQQIYNPNFYFDRYYKRTIIKKNNIKHLLKQKSNSDTFIFSQVKNNEHLIKQFKFVDDTERCEFINVLQSKDIKFSLENDGKIVFKDLCEKNPNKTVHWFKVENQFIWEETYGSCELLLPFIERKEDDILPLSENDLIREIIDKQILVIADDPGMGKSTTLTKLYQSKYKTDAELKTILESHWVIRINLRNHLQAIRNINSDKIDIVQFLRQIDLNLNNDLAENLLKVALDKNEYFSRPLLIAFDGFDEVINTKDRDKIIDILKYLKNETKCKIWITTRSHYAYDLEKALATFATQFVPINNIELFIEKYLKGRLNLIVDKNEIENLFNNRRNEKEKISQYSKTLVKKMNEIFKENVCKFIGAPLQLCLMLEGAVSHFKNWINENKSSINFNYLGNNILEIYKYFIDKKYSVFFEKIGTKDLLQQKQDRIIFDSYNKSLAKALTFKTEFKTSLNEFKNIVLSTGIVISQNNAVDFIHPTFKEYFAAEVSVHWIKKISNKFPNSYKHEYLLKEILLKSEYQFIRIFMNLMLENITRTEELSTISLKQYGYVIGKLLKENFYRYEEKFTILHIAILEGNIEIVKFILECLEKTDCFEKEEDKQNMYNLLLFRNYVDRTALHYAVIQNNYDMTKLILEKASKILCKTEFTEFLSAYDNGKLIYYYGLLGFKYRKKFAKGHKLSSNEELQLVGEIINEFQTSYGISKCSRIEECFSYLECVVNSTLSKHFPNTFGKTILHYAVQNNHYKIIKLILDKAMEMSASDREKFLLCKDAMGKTFNDYIDANKLKKISNLIKSIFESISHK